MKKIIYKLTGEVDKSTKKFPALLFRSRERNRNILIGNSPVEVSNSEYEILKSGKHSKDIILVTKKMNLPKPMEIVMGKSVKKKVVKFKEETSIAEKEHAAMNKVKEEFFVRGKKKIIKKKKSKR